MLKTVEGIYQDGRIELSSLPENVSDRSSVLIMFLDGKMVDPVQLRRLIEQLETMESQVQTIRQHDAFLNSYAPEDEGLYDDYPTPVSFGLRRFHLQGEVVPKNELLIGKVGQISTANGKVVKDVWDLRIKPQF
jgi:hypothetical protein